jgi:hypothetical protein
MAEVGSKNLAAYNAERAKPAAQRHGIYSLIRTGEFPPDAQHLRKHVDTIVAQMISDLGGESEITAQRRVILEAQKLALSVLVLASEYLQREGLLNKRGKPHPVLATIVSFMNSARLNAQALGLERRAKKVDFFEMLEAEQKETETRDGDEKKPATDAT